MWTRSSPLRIVESNGTTQLTIRAVKRFPLPQGRVVQSLGTNPSPGKTGCDREKGRWISGKPAFFGTKMLYPVVLRPRLIPRTPPASAWSKFLLDEERHEIGAFDLMVLFKLKRDDRRECENEKNIR